MIVKLEDLKPRTQGIYKINYPNGKIYIGLSVDIKRRMYEHNNFNKAKMPCDLAIKHFGKVKEVEILELVDKESDLENKEKYWIAYYNATNPNIGYNLTEGGDGSNRSNEENARAVFTNEQVLNIRKRRYEGERKKDVYKDYQDFSFSSFEHVWLGRGYPSVGKEYIIPTNSISRQEYSSKANEGLKNGRAKCTREDILEIRRLYEEEHLTFTDISKKFTNISRSTVRRIALRESYQNVV